ncbi:unnamed protein product [Diatraea saccharalis]|uniref:Uncharacterized protein n=1 Tax=Diatraea saccharalis TaxID=40085 RepID=A0A9N9N513_9NEOP|nr:unnamed protein product [Diatraea saccharalis]
MINTLPIYYENSNKLKISFLFCLFQIKLYIMYNGLIEANYRSKIYAFIAYSFCCYSVMLVTVIIGVIYACYVYIWKKKEVQNHCFIRQILIAINRIYSLPEPILQ